jgi:hypothetical protein
MTALRARLVLAGALLLVSGCGMFAKKQESPPCPRVSLVPDVGQVVGFRDGAGRDLTDVRYRAAIADAKGDCSYDSKGGLSIDMKVTIVAERGPAMAGEPAEFGYFVALADPQRRILNKEVFPVKITFASGQERGTLVDEITIGPTRLPDRNAGPDYIILLGFQLSPEEIERNRRGFGRPGS